MNFVETTRELYHALPVKEDLWSGIEEDISIAAYRASGIINRSSLYTMSSEAKFALQSTLTTTEVYRNLIGTPDVRASLPLEMLKETGGPATSPHIALDEVGNMALKLLTTRYHDVTRSGFYLYTEESDRFRPILPSLARFPKKKLFVAIDSLDESSTVAKDRYHQSFGTVIADESGHIVAGAIGSYVDDRILITENDKSWRLLSDGNLLVSDKPKPYRPPGERLRYAMLPKSTQSRFLDGTGFAHNHLWKERTFGGWAILELLSGKLDLIIDPYGQKAPEACYWGYNGQAAGLTATDLLGQPYDFDKIFPLIRTGDKSRLPLVIARPGVIERILKELTEIEERRKVMMAIA